MIISKSIQSLLSDPERRKEILGLIPIDEIYSQRRTDILRQLHAENSKITFDRGAMELRYTDSEGNIYLGFPDNYGLPIERFGKMKYYLSWMIQGISPDETDMILDRMSESLHEGMKDPTRAAMIGKCIEELRMRKRMTIHTELLYNFLAVQWVRHDENPLLFNNQIQLEKVEAFKRENADGNSYFFFQQKELKLLLNLFKMSEDEWVKYWNESIAQQRFLKAMSEMKFSGNSEKESSKQNS